MTITYHNSYDGSLIDVTSKLLGLPKPYSSTILDFGRTELRPSPHVPIVRIGAEDGEIAEEMFPIDSVGELLAEEGLLTLHDGSTRHYHDLSEYRHLHEHFGRRSLFLHRSGQILAGRGWSCSEGYRFERSAQGATYALRFEQDRHGQACVDRYLLHIDPNNLRFSTYRLNLRRPL